MANNAPPSSVTLLLTRPLRAAERFLADMPDDLKERVTPVFSPLLRIDPVDVDLNLDPDATAIFTSSNGVRYGPEGGGRTAYCVGAATTSAANGHGWIGHTAGQDADTLVAALQGQGFDGPLVQLRGRCTRGGVAARLRGAGHDVEDVIVYDQVAQAHNESAQTALAYQDATIVPLFSPRTAIQFAKQVRGATCVYVVALSAAVAEAAHPVPVHEVAEKPNADAMYRAIRRVLVRVEGHEGAG